MTERPKPKNLREQAEKKISRKREAPPKVSSREDAKKWLHDLRVHQVELEMQNEELREAQEQIEESRSKFVDLYDFAPVGYLTLNKAGMIVEANLMGAGLLGVQRSRLTGKFFSYFILPEDRDLFGDLRRKLFQAPGKQSCEIRLNGRAGGPLWVGIESAAVEAPDGQVAGMRLAVSDITGRKKAEEALRLSEQRLQALSAKLLTLQEMERKIIANEIHDGLLSDLAAVNYTLEAKIMGMDASTPLASDLRNLLQIHRRTMQEARRIMDRLRPSVLDDLGLIPALNAFCREFQTIYPQTQLECKMEVNEKEIPDPLKVVIYRVAQEAMANSARHGQAAAARMSLTKSPGGIEFLARDNGRGFDLKSIKKGVGLESMKERVEISGGEFRIESRVGRGTAIRAAWKFPRS